MDNTRTIRFRSIVEAKIEMPVGFGSRKAFTEWANGPGRGWLEAHSKVGTWQVLDGRINNGRRPHSKAAARAKKRLEREQNKVRALMPQKKKKRNYKQEREHAAKRKHGGARPGAGRPKARPPKRVHWTQRPENRERAKAFALNATKVRQQQRHQEPAAGAAE